jgi:neutral ceramidase
MEASRTVISIVCAVAVLVAVSLPSAAAIFGAGEGKVDITPSLKQFPTVSLGGFGDRAGKPAQGVHDNIYARALVLSQSRTKVALVSLDLLWVPPGLKDAVAKHVKDIGFTPDTILLAAAHDHSAPECLHPAGDVWPLAFGKFIPAFFNWTAGRIAEAIRLANMHLQQAQIGFASAKIEGFNVNRRETGEGLIDPTLTVMKVANMGIGPAARTLAIVVNFTAHPTIMGASNFLISGEWPGAMSRALENDLRREGVALFFNGAEGDQTTSGNYGSGWERVDRYGKAVADKAWELAQKIEMSSDSKIAVSNRIWSLPPYSVSPAFIESTGQEYKMTPEAGKKIVSKLFPAKVRLQAVRVGDAVFMAVPGEAIAELGLEMKKNAEAMGAKYPICVGLANNYVGYILSPKQYELGGYESGTSFYGPQLGTLLVERMKFTVAPLFK